MSVSKQKGEFGAKAHLQLELFPHSVFLISFNDDVEIIEVLDDEVVPLVHRQKDLLNRRIAGVSTHERSVQFPRSGFEYT